MSSNYFKQKKLGWCGPAALSFAMAKQGDLLSQESIARLTNTTVSEGVDPGPLERFVRGRGYTVKVFKNKKALETLLEIDKLAKQGYSVVVDYLAGGTKNSGHYVVLNGSNHDKLLIFDPEKGKTIEEKRSFFLKNWKDEMRDGSVFHHWALAFKK